MGAQGSSWAAQEAQRRLRGPRAAGSGQRAAAGPEARDLRGHLALCSERAGGGGAAQRGRACRGPGWESAETSAPVPPPHARTGMVSGGGAASAGRRAAGPGRPESGGGSSGSGFGILSY
ncbi:uncharacterized protein LOC122446714 [Cervus canadensis]|uniref:uncharacterized protein LOC122446714 n=1 Tax=Cervus canadensis TaxID=1574408 RepID=UPI001C9E7CF7|nr:uncharacterized protein LOC122446714 [Cervus canadensis]